jgi:hypothetical protein
VPEGGDKLDFRGVQAFDGKTAIVMSSGTGDLSRLYKTADGCETWKLVFMNPAKDGFFDAISFPKSLNSPVAGMGYLIGDPVGGVFALYESANSGSTWHRWSNPSLQDTTCTRREPEAKRTEALFAASNTSLFEFYKSNFLFVTGGEGGSRLFYADSIARFGDLGGPCKTNFGSIELPLAKGSSSTGAFSVAAQSPNSYFPFRLMVVGGDYTKPDASSGTAVFVSSRDGAHIIGSRFVLTVPTTSPHGYRSAVAFDADLKTWITVGPNGTDISTDQGRNWRSVIPGPGDAPDADKNWNALSLPFVVGQHGRIGVLRADALGKR